MACARRTFAPDPLCSAFAALVALLRRRWQRPLAAEEGDDLLCSLLRRVESAQVPLLAGADVRPCRPALARLVHVLEAARLVGRAEEAEGAFGDADEVLGRLWLRQAELLQQPGRRPRRPAAPHPLLRPGVAAGC